MIRSRKDKVRIFMICNLLEEANDFLAEVMGFIPEDYGIYKLKGHKNRKTGRRYKKCVIEYIAPS